VRRGMGSPSPTENWKASYAYTKLSDVDVRRETGRSGSMPR
jgi:hypothetical protein